MSSPRQLSHIVFQTNQLPAMRDWYCTVFEAQVVHGSDQLAFLTYDSEHHRIALLALQPLAEKNPQPTVGFVHAAFSYHDLTELLDNHDRLAALGIHPDRTINHGPTISFYFRDPDGNSIEFQIDRFANSADAKHWMATSPAYARNPIGVLVKPAELRARLQAGEPFARIATRDDE